MEIYSRLWVNTLIDDNIAGADISSLAIAQITSMPNAPKFTPPAQLVAVMFLMQLYLALLNETLYSGYDRCQPNRPRTSYRDSLVAHSIGRANCSDYPHTNCYVLLEGLFNISFGIALISEI